ncbi:MAG TPA: penicillin-insensitive murein endopeptidase, partial [Kofleriaceae bacterium]
DGYRVRRPEAAYGAPYVVDHLRHSIAEVRALYPGVHTLAIGDLSAEGGGKLDRHKSHQSGLDVDVGFYFTQIPDGYPEQFAPAGDTLDVQATWALVTAFARTTDLDDGVAMMFLDYALQKRLYQWAQKRGTPESDLEHLFQYPRGKDAQVGLIRHWPNHADHVHVRFKSRQ